ncbi:MAG: hypothetical protein ACI36X_08590 [Bacteroidaceae bacterium]
MGKRLLSLLLLLLLSCQDDEHQNQFVFEPIGISVCGIKDPAWITEKVGKILQHDAKRPTGVYLLAAENTDYVAIADAANSEHDNLVCFFTCTGERIDITHPAYPLLSESFRNAVFRLVWNNPAGE